MEEESEETKEEGQERKDFSGEFHCVRERSAKNSRHSLLQAQVFPYERRVPKLPALSEIAEL